MGTCKSYFRSKNCLLHQFLEASRIDFWDMLLCNRPLTSLHISIRYWNNSWLGTHVVEYLDNTHIQMESVLPLSNPQLNNFKK